jgi:hypothetical protein
MAQGRRPALRAKLPKLAGFLDEAETDVLAMIPPSAFRLSPADRPGSCR